MYARRSLLSFRRADWESSSGASVWFAGGMEVPELFLSTTVAWKHYASYPTKSFCCFVAVCQLQASRQGSRGFRFFAKSRAAGISPGPEHRPHFCRKTEELAWQRFLVFDFSSTPGLIRRQSFSDFLMRNLAPADGLPPWVTNVTNVT